MTIEAGSVVTLKSGGEPMTVVAIDGENAECVWCGEEGDLFRETIPTLALQPATAAEDDEDEDEDGEDETEDASDEDSDDEDTDKGSKRSAA